MTKISSQKTKQLARNTNCDWREGLLGQRIGVKSNQAPYQKGKKIGISKIYLEVRPTNLRAIQAYEQCGFQKMRTTEHPRNKYLPKTLKMKLKS